MVGRLRTSLRGIRPRITPRRFTPQAWIERESRQVGRCFVNSRSSVQIRVSAPLPSSCSGRAAVLGWQRIREPPTALEPANGRGPANRTESRYPSSSAPIGCTESRSCTTLQSPRRHAVFYTPGLRLGCKSECGRQFPGGRERRSHARRQSFLTHSPLAPRPLAVDGPRPPRAAGARRGLGRRRRGSGTPLGPREPGSPPP